MSVAICPACGEAYVEFQWFFDECPNCGASTLSTAVGDDTEVT